MLAKLQKDRFAPRFYVAAATDNMSLQKARDFENSLIDQVKCALSFKFLFLLLNF